MQVSEKGRIILRNPSENEVRRKGFRDIAALGSRPVCDSLPDRAEPGRRCQVAAAAVSEEEGIVPRELCFFDPGRGGSGMNELRPRH